jgi:hypothetical protein
VAAHIEVAHMVVRIEVAHMVVYIVD